MSEIQGGLFGIALGVILITSMITAARGIENHSAAETCLGAVLGMVAGLLGLLWYFAPALASL